MQWWPFIEGRYLLQGVDLREKFEEYDAERTLNLIDAILVDDAIYGADLDKNGLEKIRTQIMKIYKESNFSSYESYDDGRPAGLHSGSVLYDDTDDDGNFSGASPFAGINEAPLG